jgi:hypothetical protein
MSGHVFYDITVLMLQLDVYYPPAQETGADNDPGSLPILVFFYGGGLVRGARSSPPSHLVYNNLGAFFASRGILTVIPDYRLVPSITFPEGSVDVRDALDWVFHHFCEEDKTRRIFVLGHSAGGLHLSGFMLTPSMFSLSPAAQAIRGVILMGVPYDIRNTRAAFRDIAQKYYGGQEKIAANQPLTLLQSADDPYVATLPPWRNLIAGSEPRYTSLAMRSFTQIFKNKGGIIEEMVLDGHDHLSPVLALSSGTGEEWGNETVEWIKASW